MNGKDEHLGDGVYMADDGYQLWLAANDHRNRLIALDFPTFCNLCISGGDRFGVNVKIEPRGIPE